MHTATSTLAPLPLPQGIRSRVISDINGLDMHILEAGYESTDAGKSDRPAILLLHGFPELAFSFRKVMLPLSLMGFHVIAPDQRGYGRTTGWDDRFDGDVASFGMINLVRDLLALINALGIDTVPHVVGHDFGSMAAASAVLARPDVFKSLVMMSAPVAGAPRPTPKADRSSEETTPDTRDIHSSLAELNPPRKHYQWYYSTPEANTDMLNSRQGLHQFLRAYYHYKSADWTANEPVPLDGFDAVQLARMPTYYIMNLENTMADTVAPAMPDESMIRNCKWLRDEELAAYCNEFTRTGFQGGLNWYRCRTDEILAREMTLFSGLKINVPACFIAGSKDWGIYQRPGDIDAMSSTFCTDWRGTHLVTGAGHWVQQEQPEAVVQILRSFIDSVSAA